MRTTRAPSFELGKVALVVVPREPYEYRFDPTRPEAELARAHVEGALQKAAGRKDAFDAVEVEVSEPGARYIDFLIPGLLGMNLMSGGMWGVGFAVVDMRTRKLLKRLVASPMRKSEFIAALMMSRVVFMLGELVALLVFGYFVFDIVRPGLDHRDRSRGASRVAHLRRNRDPGREPRAEDRDGIRAHEPGDAPDVRVLRHLLLRRSISRDDAAGHPGAAL